MADDRHDDDTPGGHVPGGPIGDPVEGTDDGLAPAAAFGLLANETRLAILHALWAADDEFLSFAELRRAVAPDDTGNFNYHLGKLTGHFVRKTDAGYELRYAGEQVVRAVLAGTMTRDPTLERTTIDEACPYCDTPVEMGYDDERIHVRCPGCGGVAAGSHEPGTIMNYGFPPAGLAGRSREAVVDAAHVLYDAHVTPMMRGVCPMCAGRVNCSYDVCEAHETTETGVCDRCDTRYEVWTTYECTNCGYRRQSALWFVVMVHPSVVAFLHEHGLEESIPFRKLTEDNAPFVRDVQVEVLETDPYRFAVTVPVGDAALDLELDADLNVVASARRARESKSDG